MSNQNLRVKELERELEVEREKLKRVEAIVKHLSKKAKVGDMISILTHQWRVPISIINSKVLNLVLKYELDESIDKTELIKSLKDIESQSKFISKTVDTFRNFLTKDREIEKFNLESVILESISILKQELELSKVEIELDIDSEIELIGVQNEIEHLFFNLITNSKEAYENVKRDSKKIYISAEKYDTIAKVNFKDLATGVDDSIKDRLFEPNFSTKKGGFGLGLYICKLIVEQSFNSSLKLVENPDGFELEIYFKLTKEKTLDI